jgi:phosphoglycerate kinase
MEIKTIKKAKNLAGKKVLLRADFNVPINKNRIKDSFKIIKGLPTIRYLIKQKCKIIIITHLGRPIAGRNNDEFTVKPIATRLSRVLGKKVKFVNDTSGFKAGTEVSKMKNGEIILLENIRFEPGEIKNSKILAKRLSRLAQIFVNDAFGVSHRAHASLSAIKSFLPTSAGLLLEEEVRNLEKVLSPKKPMILVMGGIKLETKLPIIRRLYNKAQYILVGGGLANNFLAAHGYEIGKSVSDPKSIALAKELGNKKIISPIDVVVSKGGSKRNAKAKKIIEVEKDEYIYDIGPETIKFFTKYIKNARMIIWNGPLGFFEVKNFRAGTLFLARAIAARSRGSTFGLVGGGETIEALKMTKMLDCIDWVSTGGGAMLSYLGGEDMPGLKKIVKY